MRPSPEYLETAFPASGLAWTRGNPPKRTLRSSSLGSLIHRIAYAEGSVKDKQATLRREMKRVPVTNGDLGPAFPHEEARMRTYTEPFQFSWEKRG